jgi:peptidoglycan/xylan/chitin deacetylase (PgdA/CDA1 family)
VRKLPAALLAAGAVLAAAPAAHAAADPADTPSSPLDLRSADVRQDGEDLVASIVTQGEWAAGALTGRRGRSLCLVLAQAGRRFVCVTAKDTGGPALTVNGPGGTPAPLRARIQRPDARSITAHFAAREAGVKPGAFRWIVTSTWTDSGACAHGGSGCNDRLPDSGWLAARLEPPVPTGCAARGESYRANGSRERRAVALTFDDGPSYYTSRVLDVLKRANAKATFFVIGRQVRTDPAVLRRALREGHALGNHSWNHANLSGGGMGQLTTTSAAIRRATGYTPCLFRAPYGAVSATLIGEARSLGMLTIQWDVDPRDWSRPGSGAIKAGAPASSANVLGGIRSGSIVVMHDGGGPREQTLEALPGILSTLKRRGYEVVTVQDLLGLRPTYR